MLQQETIPLSKTPRNSYGTAENPTTHFTIANTIDSKVYAIFFREKFRKDFPVEINFSFSLDGGSMNIFKF